MTRLDVKRLFKKRAFRGEQIVHMQLTGVAGTATKAQYDLHGSPFPKIVMAFKVPHTHTDPASGESFDAVEIEMDLIPANEFLQQLINSVDAAMPRRARGAKEREYGE